MSEIRFNPLSPRSSWQEYRLATDALEPPVFRCRLRPLDAFDFVSDVYSDGETRLGRAIVTAALNAVVEWDLTMNGESIPCTPENKEKFLRPLLSERVVSRPEEPLLGVALVLDARNRELFLKN